MDALPVGQGIEAFTGTIWHSEALELLRALPDNSIDMILTSPPYDNLRVYLGFSWDFEAIARESHRVLKDGGVLVWVVGDAVVKGSETLTSFRQALYFVDICGFRMHQTIVWEQNSMPTKRPKAYLPDFEYMFVLSKGEPSIFNPIMRKNNNAGSKRKKGSSGKKGFKYQEGYRTTPEYSIDKNIWTIQVGGNNSDEYADHPAIFPELLAERHILSWSNENDIVLDFFSGSGTTAKIARNLNRRFIAGDLSLEYCEIARQRLLNTDAYSDSTFKDGSKQLSLFRDMKPE